MDWDFHPEVPLMMRNQMIEDQLRQGRLDAKTLDSMFRRRIEEGANCSPFVSQAILATVKEVFAIGPEEPDHYLGLGRIRLLVVAAEEPAGKPLAACQKVSALLTLDAGPEDYQVRLAHGVEGLRRRGIEVPARGQQQDIGPGQTHRVQAVRLYLQALEANEIACRLYHTLGSIENYVTTFARVAVLVDKGYADDEIAFVMRRSGPLVAAYRQLLEEFRTRPGARRRLAEILSRARAA